MSALPAGAPASGLPADALTAIGALALALLTFATLLATILISRRDSRRLRTEHGEVGDQERLAEAAAVQVIGAAITVVINHGRYPITDVTARLSRSDGSLVRFDDLVRVVGVAGEGDGHGGGALDVGSALQFERTYRPDMLTPWEAGLRFRIDPARIDGDTGVYPVIRWRDRWGQRWEHRPEHLRRIGEQDDWQA
jgi:hypothetical protein